MHAQTSDQLVEHSFNNHVANTRQQEYLTDLDFDREARIQKNKKGNKPTQRPL